MKINTYFLFLAIISIALCCPAWGDLEVSKPFEESALISHPNPALAGLKQLCVVIWPSGSEPNKSALLWDDLKIKVEKKLKEAGVKVIPGTEHSDTVDVPEIRVYIDLFKLADSQLYVFHIQTSLARNVYFAKDSPLFIKVDVWKTEPAMQTVLAESMSAVVTAKVSEQVEAFAASLAVTNSQCKKSSGASDANAASQMTLEKHTKPAAKSLKPEYQYVASKNSKVFHKTDCNSAKRISPENIIGYNNRDEAINAGRRPCKLCKP